MFLLSLCEESYVLHLRLCNTYQSPVEMNSLKHYIQIPSVATLESDKTKRSKRYSLTIFSNAYLSFEEVHLRHNIDVLLYGQNDVFLKTTK